MENPSAVFLTWFLKVAPYLLGIGFAILLWFGWKDQRAYDRKVKKQIRRDRLEIKAMEKVFLHARLAWAKKILEEYGDPDPDNQMSPAEIEDLVTRARIAWSKLVVQMEEEKKEQSR